MDDNLTNYIRQIEQDAGIVADSELANLQAQTEIAQDKNAVQANSAGLLYSNLAPTRDVQWQAQEGIPAAAGIKQNYLTTMDTIIQNGRKYNEQLNKLSETIMNAYSDL